MQIPSRLGPERLDVTVIASGFTAEEFIATSRRLFIEMHCGIRRRQRELIQLQSSKFWRDLIIIWIDMRQICEPVCRSNGELRGIVQPWIEEPPFPVHL